MPALRLRILLPVLLCGMALLGSVFIMTVRLRQELRHVREVNGAIFTLQTFALRNALADHLVLGEQEQVRRRFSDALQDPRVRTMALVDDKGTVLLSNRREWIGRPAQEIDGFQRAMADLAIRESRDLSMPAEDALLSAYFPLRLRLEANPGDEPRKGILFVSCDLSSSLDDARQRLRMEAALIFGFWSLLAVVLAVLLDRLVSRKVDRLVRTIARVEKGNLDARCLLGGTSELGLLGTAFDRLLERLAADQKELKGNGDHFRQLVMASPVPIGISDAAGKIEFLNDQFTRLFGYGQEDLTHLDSWWNLAYPDPDYRAQAQRAWLQAFEASRPTGAAIRPDRLFEVTCKDGKERTVELRAALLGDRVMVAFNDLTERVTAEKRLKDALDFNEKLLASQPMGAVVFHAQSGRCILVNQALATFLGSTEEQIRATNFREIDSWKPSGFLAAAEETIRSGEDRFLRARVRTSFGRDCWLSCSFSTFFSNGEKHLLVLVADVTGQMRAELALGESERRLHSLLAEVDQIAIILDTAGRITYCNDFLLGITGWKREEILGRDWFERFIPAGWGQVKESFQRGLAAMAIALHDENPIRTRSGAEHLIHWTNTLLLDAEGNPAGVASLGEDITERQQAQQSLETSERRFRSLFDAMNEGMALHEIITDDEGRPVDYRYLDVNPAFEVMTGIPRANWIGRTVREVIPQIEEKWIETYGRVALTGESVSIEDYAAALDRWYQIIAYCPGPRQFAVLAADITDRKRAEQALKESEERFRTLAEDGSDLVYRYRFAAPAGFDYLSPSTLPVTGYTPEELFAEGALGMKIVHPDDRPAIEAFIRTLEEPKGPVRLRWIRKDGRIIWIEQVFRYLRDATGNAFGVQGVARDVTSLVEAEEALRASEANQRALLNSMPDFLFVLSREGRFLDYHTQQIDHLMLPPEGFLGHLVAEVLPAPLAETTMAAMEAAFRTDKPQPMAYSIPFPTGLRHFEAKVTKVTGDTAMLLSRDITEQEIAKASLAASEARFRALIEEAPVPLFVHQDGRFVYCNPASVRLLGGSSASDLLGKPIMEVIHPDYHEVVRERVREAEMEGKRGERIAEKFITLDGRTVDVEAIGIRITMSGRPAILVFAEDVTERILTETLRRRLESDIRQAQKLESLGSLAGGVAHDMNNVLGAILGMATLQSDQAPAGSSLQRSMETITKACQRGATLVKGLLGFARQGLAEEKILDLNTLVHEEVALLERTTLQKVRLVTDLAADLRPVLGDAGALAHALMNLCVNAVDAMKEGGTLTLTTRNEGLKLVVLEVADTGSGMPPEVLEKALDPFFTTKPQGQGTGLGLPMVYGTVKAHRGHMTLQSEPGRGTTVTIRLPATRLGETAENEAAISAIARTPSLAILVIDDDELFQASMAAILTQLGHRPTVVSSGESALAHLAQGISVDLVILDLNMPGMGGAETLPRLRELRPDLPVVLATGRADQNAVDLIGRWKRVTLLAKPFSIQEVKAHLDDLI